MHANLSELAAEEAQKAIHVCLARSPGLPRKKPTASCITGLDGDVTMHSCRLLWAATANPAMQVLHLVVASEQCHSVRACFTREARACTLVMPYAVVYPSY